MITAVRLAENPLASASRLAPTDRVICHWQIPWSVRALDLRGDLPTATGKVLCYPARANRRSTTRTTGARFNPANRTRASCAFSVMRADA